MAIVRQRPDELAGRRERGAALELVLGKLEGVRQQGGYWMARCPAHEDRTASLSVAVGTDQPVVMKCQAGCDTSDVLAAAGLTLADVSAERGDRPAGEWTPRGPAIAVYPYVGERGELLFEVCRTAGKQFPQRRPHALAKSGWSWKLGTVRRVPYHLPQLITAARGGQTVYVVEGEKDVHAIEAAGGVATCNPGGAGKWKPEYGEHFRGADVVIVADRDEPNRQGRRPGIDHAQDVASHLREVAKSVAIVEAAAGKDAADHLAAGHSLDEFNAVAPAIIEHPERLRVRTGNRNPFDIARDVADHIVKGNSPPQLFAMGTAAVILKDDGTLVSLDQDAGAGWLAYVAERVDFTTTSKDTDRIVAPPGAVMKMLPAILILELPPLDGVVTAPYLDRDGKVVADDGYHAGSRLVLRMRGLELPAVSEKPTSEEVAAAVKLLTSDWLGEFPFDSDADKANAVAELLTITGRQFFTTVPLFVNDASTAGAGKGLLTTTITVIATGESPHFMELPGDGDEQRKTITAALLDGRSVIAWDESHIIAGRSLAMILTADVYSGRVLGSSKMISVRNRFTQIALGNNVEVRGDMKRRVLPCRLVPDDEHPEHRAGFRHPDLKKWVLENRGRLLAAVLTIWRSWDVKGRPEAKISMGSFEHWARVTGGALEAAAIKGFGVSTAEWLSYSDDDDGWSAHLAQLRGRFSDRWFTVSDVADACEAGLLKRPPVKRDEKQSLALQLAYAYRGQREKWYANLRLVRSKGRDSATGGRTWAVRQRGESPERVGGDGSVGSGTSSVSSVSSVFAGQPAFEGTDDATDDESIVSRRSEVDAAKSGLCPDPARLLDTAGPQRAGGRPEASSVSSVDRQYRQNSKRPGQVPSTDDTDDTDDESGPVENETSDTSWPEGSEGAAAAAETMSETRIT